MQVSYTLTLAGFRISEPVQASSIFHKNTANYSAFIEKVGPGGGGTIYIYIYHDIIDLPMHTHHISMEIITHSPARAGSF